MCATRPGREGACREEKRGGGVIRSMTINETRGFLPEMSRARQSGASIVRGLKG